MQSTVQDLIEASRKLTPIEQLQLLNALAESVYDAGHEYAPDELPGRLLPAAQRASVIMDVHSLVADFWPEDETADDLIDFVYLQRQADRAADL